MLKLHHTNASPLLARLPQTTLLGISWVHGRFSAVALHRGTLGLAWTCPSAVNTPQEFAVALKEAVSRTSYQGNLVSLVMLHPQFTHQWVEIPSGKSGPLQKYLQRQAEQQKPFNTAPAWAFQLTVPHKSGGGALLHLMPAALRNGLRDACLDLGLHLVSLAHGSEVVRAQVKQVSPREDEVVLLATANGDSTLLLAARGDGTPLLVRSVPGTWTGDPGRVGIELNRTLLYAQEHFGVVIANIWISGPDSETATKALAGFTEATVKASPAPTGEFSWAEEALRLSGETPANLISREDREAPKRKTVLKFSSYAAGAIFFVAVGFAGYVRLSHSREIAAIRMLTLLEKQLQQKHHDLQEHFQEIERKRSFLELARPDRPDPVATWVLGSVTESLPSELLLTELSVVHETNQFRVTLGGTLQPTAEAAGTADIRHLTRQLAHRLSDGPLGMEFSDELLAAANGAPRPTNAVASVRDKGALDTASFNNWSSRLKDLTAGLGTQAKTKDFLVQGVMR